MIVAARIRSLFFSITMRSVIIIITHATTPPQSIQDKTGRPNSRLCQQRNGAADCCTRCFCRLNNYAHSLDIWHHEESVTDRKDRCAIDHHSIKQGRSLCNQLAEERAGKNLSGIGCASSTSQNKQLAASRGENVFSQFDALIDELDFSW